MNKKFSRWLGGILLLSALFALWAFAPSLFPNRQSTSGFVIVKHPVLVRLALGYLVAGMTAGFGLALLVWPFTQVPKEQPVPSSG